MTGTSSLPDVYTADEIARAAGVRTGVVRALADRGTIHRLPEPDGRFFSTADAVVAVRLLVHGKKTGDRTLFRQAPGVRRKPGMPLAASSTLHAAMLALVAFVTSMNVANTQARVQPDDSQTRLVFLMSPGPGGGGGGGGMKQPTPPPPAQKKGVQKLRSPVPPVRHRPAEVAKVVRQAPPPPRIEPPPVVRPQEPPRMEKAQA